MTIILVDDSNPNIQYGPGWVSTTSSLAQANLSYPMYGTLHETINPSELKFTFSGSSIFACAQVSEGTMPDSTVWTCYVDNVHIASSIIEAFPPICCSLGGLEAQVQHEIHILATGSQDRSVLFDYLTYETSTAVPTADLLFDARSPMFNFSEGWEREELRNLPSEPFGTTQVGANLTFDFYGSSVLWFGFYNKTLAGHNESTFSFAVDNDEPIDQFLEPVVAQGLTGSTQRQALFFRTFALPRGQHILKVVYNGRLDAIAGSKAIPLSLVNLVVQNGTANPNMSVTPSPTMLTTASTTLTTSPTISTTTTGNRNSNLAIVVGCSSAAVLVLLILGIFCTRRRMKKRKRASVGSIGTSSLEPFNHDSASAPAGTRQKSQRIFEEQERPIFEPAGVGAPPSDSVVVELPRLWASIISAAS
ncbi:hypothetical protein GALMADRAFT_141654 [Galerina marginata CBS 339.88]|uniref:Uncharacterized protein n=1 Tax=Galerina marginata (strain CBS 339.88) TaxID=685588 RepID=A0A067SV00_GALM3|nr:hypothetical protein GALMADRAFT_141654 [Galerina marginata CBS 339.88]